MSRLYSTSGCSTLSEALPAQSGQGHFPQPAGHASFGAAQDTGGFVDCEGTLLAHM